MHLIKLSSVLLFQSQIEIKSQSDVGCMLNTSDEEYHFKICLFLYVWSKLYMETYVLSIKLFFQTTFSCTLCMTLWQPAQCGHVCCCQTAPVVVFVCLFYGIRRLSYVPLYLKCPFIWLSKQCPVLFTPSCALSTNEKNVHKSPR